MQDEPPNPYQAPSISVETEAKLNAVKFHPLRYFASLLLVFFLTAILAPMDTGVWQSRAMIAECFVYALYLIAQMLVFRGRIREQAITHGPTICFFVSVALVVTWTVAMETRVLPYPPYIRVKRVVYSMLADYLISMSQSATIENCSSVGPKSQAYDQPFPSARRITT